MSRFLPDRRRWGVVALLGGLLAANNLDRGNLAAAAPLIMAELHLSNAEIGLVLSAFQWTYALANLPMGFLADRLDAKRLIGRSALAWSCLALATGFAPGLVGLLIMRAGLGAAEAPMFPAAIRIVTGWFPERERARAVSAYQFAAQLGFAAAVPLATWIMVPFGWRWMFVAIAVIGLAPLALWQIFYREPRQPRDTLPSVVDAPGPGDWLWLARHPQPWIMFAGGFCLAGAMGFYTSWLPLFLERSYGFSLQTSGLLTGVVGAAGLAGLVCGGHVSDRLIRRGLTPLLARRLSLVLSCAVAAPALAALAIQPRPTLGMPLVMLGMFAAGCGIPSWWALVGAVAPSTRLISSLGGIQNAGIFFGAAIAPIVIGALIDASGGFAHVLLLAALLILVAVALYGLALRSPIKGDNGNT